MVWGCCSDPHPRLVINDLKQGCIGDTLSPFALQLGVPKKSVFLPRFCIRPWTPGNDNNGG
jgi:hypothetical protein